MILFGRAVKSPIMTVKTQTKTETTGKNLENSKVGEINQLLVKRTKFRPCSKTRVLDTNGRF